MLSYMGVEPSKQGKLYKFQQNSLIEQYYVQQNVSQRSLGQVKGNK